MLASHSDAPRVVRIETIPILEPWATPNFRDFWCPTPMDVFEDYDRKAGPGTGVAVTLVRVVADNGLDGWGTIGIASPAFDPMIEHKLAPIVVGNRVFDVELIWEKLFRATVNMGRKGFVLEAISAIDIALWDLIGKTVEQPLYNLLGGQTRSKIRAYASQLYAMDDLDALADEARGYAAQGFTAVKMRFGYGPADREPGKRRNSELVRTVREAIGPDIELAADAYMGWDEPYAIDMIRRLEEFNLAWVEEPVLPDNIDGYARIRAAVPTPISGGEHEFTRWGYRELITRGAVDIVQPDVNRMGGITEARKVFALASAFNLSCIPHSNQAHNAHLIASHMNAPLIEYFPRELVSGYTFFGHLFDGEPEVVDGFAELSDRPGLGIAPNWDTIDQWRADKPA
jgi:L-alanine-DL-glutamate epimerase-like enolase superfamily enzyme